MLKFMKRELNKTTTENGALTYRTTCSGCLDLFGVIGALRNEKEDRIWNYFWKAWAEDRDLAMKILFFARDVRGGLGERRVFRVILRRLAEIEPASVKKNIPYIAEYGRYDDLLLLLDTSCCAEAVQLIEKQLAEDLEAARQEKVSISLLAKWLPSVNASSKETVKMAKQLAKLLHKKEAAYRHELSFLRKKIAIIENNLRERDYTFDYSKQPSRAMYKYRKAFIRNDKERYVAFIKKVSKGEAVLHTGTLYPYDIIAPLTGYGQISLSDEEKNSIDATWKSLPDYTKDENALVVVDGSGSMYQPLVPKPAAVALSLGIYFAERNKGKFHNHFITFSEHPQLVEIKGTMIHEKVSYCASFNEVANTNLQAVFELILNTARNNELPQSEMPERLYIITDMEFDRCTTNNNLTNFERAKRLYEENGYHLPEIVFWNVANRNTHQPVTMNEQGVALVSGCSPRLFDMVISDKISPYDTMISILNSERYQKITA